MPISDYEERLKDCYSFDGRYFQRAELPPEVEEQDGSFTFSSIPGMETDGTEYRTIRTRFPQSEWELLCHPVVSLKSINRYREYFVYQHKEHGFYAIRRISSMDPDVAGDVFYVPDVSALALFIPADIGGYVDDQIALEFGHREPRENEEVVAREELVGGLVDALQENQIELPIEDGPKELFDQIGRAIEEQDKEDES